MDQLKNWIPVDTYNALRLSKYRDNYSIMLGKRGDQDTYDAWVNPMRWQNGKNVPVLKKDGDLLTLPFQLPLGNDKAKALEILKALILQVEKL